MTQGRAAGARGRRPRQTITGRTLVLGAVCVLMLVLLASPVHRYFVSRSAVAQSAEQLRRHNQELAHENQQLQRWSDPGYVQQQARQRLQYAMPGDTVFTVLRPGSRAGIDPDAGKDSTTQRAGTWNTRLWTSVRAAGR